MFGLAPLPRTLAAALRDVNSAKVTVRASALKDLVRHARSGEAEAARALAAALEDSDPGVRAEAALGLADADRSEHAVALARVADHDTAPRVRQMALLALGELAPKDSAPVLATLNRARVADDPAERFQALLALHQLGAPDEQAVILEALLDPDPEIRRLALRIARARWADADRLPESIRAGALRALSDAHPAVAARAALVLAEFGDLTGRKNLLALVARTVPGATVEDEQGAIERVAELRIEEAVPALSRRAFPVFARDALSFDARIALARFGDSRARAAIVRGLSAWTYDARTYAVVAAGRARLVEARPRLLDFLHRPDRADAQAVRDALAELDRGELHA